MIDLRDQPPKPYSQRGRRKLFGGAATKDIRLKLTRELFRRLRVMAEDNGLSGTDMLRTLISQHWRDLYDGDPTDNGKETT